MTDVATRKVEITIDGATVSVEPSATVLEAALEHGVFIPHLCHDPDLEPAGVCRLCLVGKRGPRRHLRNAGGISKCKHASHVAWTAGTVLSAR